MVCIAPCPGALTFLRRAFWQPENASLLRPPAPSSLDPPPCYLIVHFHFVKSAGTALRDFMSGLTCEAALHRNATSRAALECLTHRRVQRLREGELELWAKNTTFRTEVPRAYIEMHWPETKCHEYNDGVERLRGLLHESGSPCRVLTVALLREPASQIVSHYHYFGKQHNAKHNTSLSLRQYAEQLLQPEPFWRVRTQSERFEGACIRGACTPACQRQVDRFGALLGRIDLIGSTDEFDEMLVELAHFMGVALPSFACQSVLCASKTPINRNVPCEHTSWQRHARKALSTARAAMAVRDFAPCSNSTFARWQAHGRVRLSRSGVVRRQSCLERVDVHPLSA